MTDADSSIDQDRNAFASHAAEFWRLLRAGDSKSANLQSDAAGCIARLWSERGRGAEFLGPLLAHDDEAVRYAAAAESLSWGEEKDAVRVLRELAQNPNGLVAPTAKLLLLKRGH